MARCRDKNVSLHAERPYAFPPVRRTSPLPPVVVGMGPAGLFAALFLARNGVIPIVLERGRPVEKRTADVERFWATGALDTASNVQFGEGGAGTFSDGKLTTGTHDPRISTVFRTLVEAGAPADILYQRQGPTSAPTFSGTWCAMCGGSCWPWGATCVSGTGWRAWTCGTASCGPLRWTVPAAGTTCPATRWCSPPDTPPATLSRCCWTPECPWPQALRHRGTH
mgnify:CR=1 FL=1